AAAGLRASRRQVGRCRLDGRHALGARGQELEAERADAGADVEHGLPVPGPENGIPQQAGGGVGPSRPVALEIASGGGITELTLVGGPEGGAARDHGVNGGFTCDLVREKGADLLLRRWAIAARGAHTTDTVSGG